MLILDQAISPKPLPYLVQVLIATSLICWIAPIEIGGGAVVPVSLQTLIILIFPFWLGKWRAFLAVSLYLLLGFAGLPVFAEGTSGIEKLWGPTGGFLLAFAGAAFVIGYLAEKGWAKDNFRIGWGFLLGHVLILVPGFIWLAVYLGSADGIGTILWTLLPGLGIKTLVGTALVVLGNRLLKKWVESTTRNNRLSKE